jgi:hypothetical protein
MRWRLPFLCLLWAIHCSGRAQSHGVEVRLVMDESVFLPGEEIPVGVKISNLSGRPLTFGALTNWLTFHIETRGGELVDRLAEMPVRGEFTLDSAKAATTWWNVQPYFALDAAGSYVVMVDVRLPEWKERVLSDGLRFIIQPSRSLWEVSFGVPPPPGQPDAEPEVRRYALQSATRRDERRLYARVSDETGSRIYRVVPLDRLLSFSHPVQQLDSLSQLHVIFQTGGSTYTYCVVNPAGRLVVRQRHEITPGSRPRLVKTVDGRIEVTGGRRVPALSDIPPYDPAVEEAPAVPTLESAPVTNAVSDAKSARRSRRERRER